jgi:type IV secretory pathway VirB10-like protein
MAVPVPTEPADHAGRALRRVSAAIALAVLAAAVAAQAQVYRWVDEQGKVHYGERPPTGAKASPVQDKLAAPPGAPAPKAAPDASQQERDFQRRRMEREQKAAREQQAAEKAKQQCERERSRLAQMRTARRISAGVDDKGDRRYLSDAERADAIAGQEGAVARACR